MAYLLMYFSIPIVCGVLCLCFGMHYFVFCNHLEKEEKAGWFALMVLQMLL